MSVDTLSLARDLRSAELTPSQAEAIAAAIGRAVVETSATKSDLAELRITTRADLAQLEERLGARIDRQGGDLRTEIAKLDTRIEASVTRLLYWFIGALFAVAGLTVALVKFLPAQG